MELPGKLLPGYIGIQSLCGMEELKGFADKLLLTAENARRIGMRYPTLPNLILEADHGFGITRCVHLVAILLKEQKLMRFSGEEECFELCINNIEKDFDGLLRRVNLAAGFYAEFNGVIGLDLSGIFRRNEQLPDISRLMEFIDDQQGRIMFLCVIPLRTPAELSRQFKRQFISRTPLVTLRLPFPTGKQVLPFTTGILEERGFTLSPEAEAVLLSAIERLLRDKDFEGFQTLTNLTDEIIWRLLSGGSLQTPYVTEEALQFLREDEFYLTSAVLAGGRTRRIGFQQ